MGTLILCLELAQANLEQFAPLREELTRRGIHFHTLEEQQARYPETWLARFARMDNATRTGDKFAPRTLDEIALRVADIGPEPAGCLVAGDGTDLIGYTYFHAADGNDPHRARQGWTGVVPEYRRQGIATALKIEGILLARRFGFERMVTDPNDANIASVRLSRRVGFVPCGTDAGGLPQ